MTVKEVLDMLNDMSSEGELPYNAYNAIFDAVDSISDTIEEMDLISRNDTLKEIGHAICEPDYYHTGEDWCVGLNIADGIVSNMPTITSGYIKYHSESLD